MGDDREKLSYSERDRLRQERAKGYEQPRGRAGQQRQAQERDSALKEAESIFSAEGKGGERGDELAKAIRAAHGTAELPEACHAFVTEIGLPNSVDLLQIFIDTADVTLVVPALEELLARKAAGELEVSGGLRSQLRILAADPDDDIAGLSEDLLT